jgi:RHS repeat-associated protein
MYDGFRRMNAVLTQSDYDGQMPVYEQQTSGGNPVWKRWNALGARGIDAYYNSTSSSWLYPLYDVHGNVKATLTRSGATGYSTANWKSYDVWGGERASTGSGSMFGYCGNLGHPTEPENGIIYMRARFNEPWTGRFLNEDPARSGSYWYAYASNGPSSFSDFTGKYAEVDYWAVNRFLAIGAFLAGVGAIRGLGPRREPHVEAAYRKTFGVPVGTALLVFSAFFSVRSISESPNGNHSLATFLDTSMAFMGLFEAIAFAMNYSGNTGVASTMILIMGLHSVTLLGLLIQADIDASR